MNHKYQEQINKRTQDQYGFLPDVDYHFKPNGEIDWRRMVPLEFVSARKDKFPEGTDLSSLDVSKLEDDQLLIALEGLREVLRMRGYISVEKTFSFISSEHIMCSCNITVPSNYDGGVPKIYTGEGDAHPGNTDRFFSKFLTAMAGNRAEARAIKTILGIKTLAKEELGGGKNQVEESAPTPSISNPIETLRAHMKKNNRTEQEVMDYARKKKWTTSESNSISDFPKGNVVEMIGKLQKK